MSGPARGGAGMSAVLFGYAFRPFFLAAGLWAAIAVPLWALAFAAGLALPAALPARDWHVHEMIFGYLGAVMAGFLFTAIPSWTAREPVRGLPLAALFALWLAGRLAVMFGAAVPAAALSLEAAFLVAVAATAWREVLAGRNWRNAPVCILVSLFAAANLVFHAERIADTGSSWGERIGLAVAAFLVALIGGRITPAFTRNWLAARGAAELPAPFGRLDGIVLIVTAAALVSWCTPAPGTVTGTLLLAAGAGLFARLARWRGPATLGDPLLAVLHVGYGWLALALVLLGAAALAPDLVDPSQALHALTAGAFGVVTLAVMTRASLGHSGRPLACDGWTLAVYVLVNAGAILRLLPALIPAETVTALTVSGLVWSLGYLIFVLRYAPILLRPAPPATAPPVAG